MALLFDTGIFSVEGLSGEILAGAKLYFYASGTSTPQATYSDPSLDPGLANTNPVVASADGRFGPIWLQPLDYKVILKPFDDSEALMTRDPVQGAIGGAALSIGAASLPSSEASLLEIVDALAFSHTPSGTAGSLLAKTQQIIAATDEPFGATGDGSTDDYAALQAWLDAIPEDGVGYIPPAPGGYYKCGTALVRSNRGSIIGGGLASRIHYTGSGVALTFSEARFCRLENWYLTGTSSATGGVWFKEGQEGLQLAQFYTDSFTGSGAYAWRFSDCWTFQAIGGAARQSTNGILLDTTDLGAGGINNSFSLIGVNCSETGIGIDYQAGNAGNIIGCDFSNAGAIASPVAAIEIGRGLSGSKFVGAVNIVGCWFEGTGAGVRVGRDNTSSATPKHVTIGSNYFGNSGDQVRLYKSDRATIHESQWGSGNIIIDSGVTNTTVFAEDYVGLTNNASAGEVTFYQQSGPTGALGDFTALRVGGSPYSGSNSVGLEVAGAKAFLLPRLTSTQRDALTGVAGMLIYNLTNARVEVYSGGTWGTVA